MNNSAFTKLKLIFWEAYPDESLFGEFAKHTVDGLDIRRSPPGMYNTRPKWYESTGTQGRLDTQHISPENIVPSVSNLILKKRCMPLFSLNNLGPNTTSWWCQTQSKIIFGIAFQWVKPRGFRTKYSTLCTLL